MINKNKLKKIQNDILECKGIFVKYLVLLLICSSITANELPVLSVLPRIVLGLVGAAYLIPIYVLFKSERTRKQNVEIFIYIILLIAFAISAVLRLI